MKKLLLLNLFVLVSSAAFPQSTKGKEFWIGFMENLSLSFNGPPVFRLHISSDVTTTATVSIPYTGYTSTFTVTANQAYVFTLPSGNFNPFGDESVANNGIRIISADSVEVKAFHHRAYFSESTLILPVSELGTDYLVTALTDQAGNSPSEFVVMATQNITPVEIIPSVVTLGTRPIGVAFTVTLQMGQMYQLQSFSDLSGTSVRSLDPAKKIVVFGGARQARLDCVGGADDHIYDQLYPVSSLGHIYNVVPFSGHLYDVIKILASQNSTSVSVTNGTTYTLNKGQFATFTVNASCVITSDKPVAVSQLATSASCNGQPNIPLGDPGMISLVPAELYHKKTIFYTPSSIKLGSVSDFFPEHRLNIVIKTSAIGNLKLDNNAIASNSFTPLTANSNYSYARLVLDTLSSLQHILECDSGFNASIYSFTSFNFYGHHLGYNNAKRIGSTIGLRTNTNNSALRIFPVPAEKILTINAAKAILSVVITDMVGKEVLVTPRVLSNEVILNVDRLTEGVYYCRILYDDDEAPSDVVKFVKISKE